MASPPPSRGRQRRYLLAAALVIVAGLLIAAVLTSGLMEAAEALVLGLRSAGPVVFFLAMAVLPAAGFPLLAFTLAAGPVFGPTLGLAWVVVWSLAAVVVNLLLTYWLASRALRPFARRVLEYFGIPLPADMTEGAWQITLIVRLTPGPPFWLQSYLLGLIRVPLGPYLAVSTGVMAGYILALVGGGAAMAEGNVRLAVVAAGVLVVSIATLQLLRQRLVRRRANLPGAHLPQALPAE